MTDSPAEVSSTGRRFHAFASFARQSSVDPQRQHGSVAASIQEVANITGDAGREAQIVEFYRRPESTDGNLARRRPRPSHHQQSDGRCAIKLPSFLR
ncbi:MAG: hypothetical protein ACLR17_00365 [Enterobacteriaceae bacterium]